MPCASAATSDGSLRYRWSIRAGSTAPRDRGVTSATGKTHFHAWGAAGSGSIQGKHVEVVRAVAPG